MVTSTMTYGRVEANGDAAKAFNFEEPKEYLKPSEEGKKLASEVREPRYKNIVHLWEFLLELLAEDNCRPLITWISKERGEFKLKNPEEVAKRWGILKRKKGMNYEKLGRALRYYYQQGIIKKVPGQRLAYKFNKLPYKYEPGVTRSPRHANIISASIHEEQELVTPEPPVAPVTPTTPAASVTPVTPVTPPPTQKAADVLSSPAVFFPTSMLYGKKWSWPITPVPIQRCPRCLCTGSSPLICNSGSEKAGSRIMFPIVAPFSSPLPFSSCFEPVKPFSSMF